MCVAMYIATDICLLNYDFLAFLITKVTLLKQCLYTYIPHDYLFNDLVSMTHWKLILPALVLKLAVSL